MKDRRFIIGDYVYWSDPDDGLCDVAGTITEILDDTYDDTYVITLDTGGIVEAYAHELSHVDRDLIR